MIISANKKRNKAQTFRSDQEQQLVEAIKKSEGWPIDLLWEESHRTIYRSLGKYAKKTNADDVFADAYLILKTQLIMGKYENRDDKGLIAYFIGIIKNAARDWRKAKKKHRDRSAFCENPFPTVVHKHPLSQLIDRFDRERIYPALEQIGDKCKKILMMFYLEGMKLDEIALMMNYQPASMKQIKNRCLKKLIPVYHQILDLTLLQNS